MNLFLLSLAHEWIVLESWSFGRRKILWSGDSGEKCNSPDSSYRSGDLRDFWRG